jgi:hypothetical protein
VTLRVAAIEGDEDHDGTWLLGHTERIDFGSTFEREGELWSNATIHVPCRYLQRDVSGKATCGAHGFTGRVAEPARAPAPRRLGRDRFAIVDKGKLVARKLDPPRPPRRGLPVLSINPCAAAPCHTSDNRRGDACCRDIQVDICCTTKETRLEALIRSRQSPYLCKTEREDDKSVVVEIISACGFLKEEGGCDLHGRTRADGRPAKPVMCSHWPGKRSGLHGGCAFKSRKVPL